MQIILICTLRMVAAMRRDLVQIRRLRARGMSVRRHRMWRQSRKWDTATPATTAAVSIPGRHENTRPDSQAKNYANLDRMANYNAKSRGRRAGSGRQPQTSFHRSQPNVPCPCGQLDATWWPPSLQSHS